MIRTNNENVIKNYLQFIDSKSHNENLFTRYNYDGEWELVNYRTPLVRIVGNTLYLNTKKYSVTTSKIQTYIKREIANTSYEIVEM